MHPTSALGLLLLFAQIYIVMALLGAAGRRWSGRKHYAACAALLLFEALVLAAYLNGFSYRFRLHFGGLRPVLGAISLVYLAASAAILALYLVLRPIRKHLDSPTNSGRRRALDLVGTVLLCSPVAAISYGSLIQRTNFKVREIDVPMPGLSADLDGLRILQISDIHLSPFLSEKELARMIDATLGLHPHIAFITGDLISSKGDPLDACIRQLARVKADAGVFGCLGNHENYAGVERETTVRAATFGMHFLRSQTAALRFGNSILNVAGIDYQPSYRNKRYIHGAPGLTVPGAFNLLLSHNPDVFPLAVRQGYDLVLAGHTHGGQVNIEIFGQSVNPARFYTPYVYGLYCQDRSVQYVTSGIGTIGVPVRLGAPPEVALLRLRKTWVRSFALFNSE